MTNTPYERILQFLHFVPKKSAYIIDGKGKSICIYASDKDPFTDHVEFLFNDEGDWAEVKIIAQRDIPIVDSCDLV